MDAAGASLAAARGVWRRRRADVVAATGAAALLATAFVVGAGSAFVTVVAGGASPLVLVALVAIPLLALAVFVNPIVGIFAVLATMPIGSAGVAVAVVGVQAVEAAVLVVAMLVVLRRLALGLTPLPWAPPFGVALALIAWVAVALYSALDETLAIKQLLSLMGGLVFAAVVLAAARDLVDLRRILGAFVLAATTAAMIAISGAGSVRDVRFSGSEVTGRLHGAFDEPNQMGTACAMALAVAAGLAFGARTRRGQALAALSLPILMSGLLLTLSRGAWIGAALAIALLLLTLREARELLLFLSIPLIVVALIGGRLASEQPQFTVIGERARAITVLSPYDERQAIWREAMREIRDDPLTGQGPGNFPVASVRAASEASLVSAKHAHNLALNWAAESGLPALALVLAFALSLVVSVRRGSQRLRREGRNRDRAVLLGIAAALVAVAGQGMVDYTLGNPVVHVAFWLLVGSLVVASRERTPERVGGASRG